MALTNLSEALVFEIMRYLSIEDILKTRSTASILKNTASATGASHFWRKRVSEINYRWMLPENCFSTQDSVFSMQEIVFAMSRFGPIGGKFRILDHDNSRGLFGEVDLTGPAPLLRWWRRPGELESCVFSLHLYKSPSGRPDRLILRPEQPQEGWHYYVTCHVDKCTLEAGILPPENPDSCPMQVSLTLIDTSPTELRMFVDATDGGTLCSPGTGPFAQWLRAISPALQPDLDKACEPEPSLSSIAASLAGTLGTMILTQEPSYTLEFLPPPVLHPGVRELHGSIAQLVSLQGLWQAPYGGHGLELMHIAVEAARPEMSDHVMTTNAASGMFGFPFLSLGQTLPTMKIGSDIKYSTYWGPRSNTCLPPDKDGVTFRGLRVSCRKIIGDPNVPSGQYSFVASLESATRLKPEQAIPDEPVLWFPANGAARIRNLREEWDTHGFAIFPACGQINMTPHAWNPSWEKAALFVWNAGRLGPVASRRAAGGGIWGGDDGLSELPRGGMLVRGRAEGMRLRGQEDAAEQPQPPHAAPDSSEKHAREPPARARSAQQGSAVQPQPALGLTFSLLWYDMHGVHHVTDYCPAELSSVRIA